MAKINNLTLSIDELNDLAHFLYNEMFDEETNIGIKINTRLRTTLGQFVYCDDYEKCKDCRIEISKVIAMQNIYVIADILSHELTHYYCWKHKIPHDDKDIEFIMELRKNEVIETNICTTRRKSLLTKYAKIDWTCDCGYETTSYEVASRNKRTLLYCPTCKTPMHLECNEFVVKEYMPTILVQKRVDKYLSKKEERKCS